MERYQIFIKRKNTKMTKRQAKAKCERIAREAGAELTWHHKGEPKHDYGYYIPGTNKICVGASGNVDSIVTIFCHELAHYKNFLEGKYWKYHSMGGKKFMRKFKTKDGLIRYALKAEIYTDKRGRRIAKQLFPDIKYRRSYKMNKRYYNMMYQKYFGGYFIIIIDEKTAFIVKKDLTNVLRYDMVS